MHPDLLIHTSLVALLVFFSALLTLTKVSLVVRYRARNSSRADGSYRPEQIAAVRSALTLVLVLVGAYGGWYLKDPLGAITLSLLNQSIQVQDTAGAGTFLILVFLLAGTIFTCGDVIPRRIALRFPVIAHRLTSPIASASLYLFRPFIRITNGISNALFPSLSIVDGEVAPSVTEEEVQVMLDKARESGLIHPAEQRIVTKVFRFGSRQVSSLMTHRNDIVWLDCNDPMADLWDTARKSGFSHFPVMRGSIDDVVGVVSIGELAEQFASGLSRLELSRCREPYQVPANSGALAVLQRFQEHKRRFALVIDEYGGIDGLITTHDLMEALVGEIGDGDIAQESTMVQREDGSFLVDASVDLEDMMDRIGIRLPIERERKGFFSLGGLIMEQLGHVPSTGERFRLAGVEFEVVDMDGYRIDKVLVKNEQTRISPSPAHSSTRRLVSSGNDATQYSRKKLKKAIG